MKRASFGECLDLNADEIMALQEGAELLYEQVESLKQALIYQQQDIEQYKQELQMTNDELALINCELAGIVTSQRLEIDKAKGIALTILKNKKSSKKLLEELISAIYSSPVKLENLEQIDQSNTKTKFFEVTCCKETIIKSKEILANTKELINQCKEIAVRFVEFKTYFRETRGEGEKWTRISNQRH